MVVTPWKRRWELGPSAGMSDDYHFIEAFTRHGYDVHFVNPRYDASEAIPFEGYWVHAFPNFFDATNRWPTALKRLLWPVAFNVVATVRALRVAARERPVFVLGQSHYAAFAARIVHLVRRIPSGVKLFGVMDLVRSDWPWWKYTWKNLEQILALKIPQDAWIILDDGTRGDVAARRHGVPASRIHFLPNGMNLEWLETAGDAAAARRDFAIPDGSTTVLFLARLQESKRPELFIQAIPHALKRSHRPVFFVVAGDGPERTRCESLVRELGIEDSVGFPGVIPHDRVPDIMAAADAFVATGRMSNMALSTCEAMVCGTPVIACDIGNTREVVRDGETGYVVRDGDPVALGNGIAAIVNDPDKGRCMGERARAFAGEAFTSWRERMETEVAIVERLIGER